MTGTLLLACIIGYFIGAIPTGYLTGRLLVGVDVRAQGSGKTGATNVRRVLGWKGFVLVYVLDVLKGAVAVLAANWLLDGNEAAIKATAGVAAVIGHCWPVYLGFKGGRGVAPGTGAMLAMIPQVMIVSALLAVPLMFLSRYVSLGSVVGAALTPLLALVAVAAFDRPWAYFLYAAIAASLILVKHKDNIERLLTGTERRL